jgi:hypothetical protein
LISRAEIVLRDLSCGPAATAQLLLLCWQLERPLPSLFPLPDSIIGWFERFDLIVRAIRWFEGKIFLDFFSIILFEGSKKIKHLTHEFVSACNFLPACQ